MTDRVRTLTVILEADTRDDDAGEIAKLIRAIRYVDAVELGPVVDMDDHIVRSEIRREIGKNIWALITGSKIK